MKLVGLIARGVRRELSALPLLPALFDKLKEKKTNVSDVSDCVVCSVRKVAISFIPCTCVGMISCMCVSLSFILLTHVYTH